MGESNSFHREQILINIASVEALTSKLATHIGEGDKNQMNIASKALTAALEQLIGSVHAGDLKQPTFDHVRNVIEAAQALLGVATESNGKVAV